MDNNKNGGNGASGANTVIVTCLNRFLRRCVGCERDYDLNHHPNNLDCPYYWPMKLGRVDVKDVEGGNNGKNG